MYGSWTLLLFIAFLFTTCKRALPPEEGRKHLKAFDSEVIQLASRIGKTEAFRALLRLSEIHELPIPFMNAKYVNGYDFNTNKGVYSVKSRKANIVKQAESNMVELVYPFDSKWDSLAIFTLMDYAETQTALQMIFPQKFEAKITAGEKTLFTAHLSATYKHGMPADMDVVLLFAGFKIKMLLNTTFKSSYAVLNLEFELEENGARKLSTSLTSNVKTVNNSLVYDNIDVSLTAFPIRLRYQSDQDFLNTEAKHFIETYNKHTQIDISSPNGNRIGQVFLAQLQGRDRINPMIHYADGSVENLEDMLFILQKLLNMKMFILDDLADNQPPKTVQKRVRP
ncbi:MAG: hypothetical protein K8F24_01440 [Bacteroidales bacterium]|nr:hypothetical protein [Bacteroidales bacterium]